ncbi:MAG: class I SAM-dependent methyltransferase [Vitreimonas sp.]
MADRFFADPQLAAFYEPLHPRASRDDFAFYLPLVMKAPSALDVGCGDGGLFRLARESGHKGRLCGLDPARGILEIARRRADVEWVLGDLREAAWDREFHLAIMTGHAFQVLIEDAEIECALAAVRQALVGEGRFAFETRNPRARAWEQWTPENAVDFTDRQDRRARMSTQVDNVEGEIVSFTHTFTREDWSAPQESKSTLRFLDADAIAAALAKAGLKMERQYGDWDRSDLRADSPEIITLARRA